MGNDDVYLRYRPTNSDWVLKHPGLFTSSNAYGGNDVLVDTMIVHCVGVSIDVANDINQFKGIDSYYVRRSIRSNVFFNLNKVGSISNNILMAYNVDPWGRQFPFFVNGIASGYYNSCENKIRYGYWVFYHNRVLDNGLLINNVVPQMILTTTSLDGVSVGCLDLIEG